MTVRHTMTMREAGRRGGQSGRGARKARTTVQARRAAHMRWARARIKAEDQTKAGMAKPNQIT